MRFKIAEREGACTFRVRVAPRGRRDEVLGKYGDAIKVRLKAPPIGGKANRALREYLAAQLGVSRAAVEILAGHSSRWKRVQVEGVSADSVRSLLSGD